MSKEWLRFTRHILLAVAIGVFFSVFLHFLAVQYLHPVIFIFIGCLITALVLTWLINNNIAKLHNTLIKQVDRVSIGTAEISHSLDRLQKSIFMQADLSHEYAEVVSKLGSDASQLIVLTQAAIDAVLATKAESETG